MMNMLGNREELAKLLTGVGVEVGTEQGEFAEVIAKCADRLTCVDAWLPYKGYRDHTGREKLENFYEITKDRLFPYKNVQLIRGFSTEIVKIFDDNYLDFAYIDANHSYDYVMEDIINWTRKVKRGGIVAGDDYTHRKGQENQYAVIEAVNDYCRYHNIELNIFQDAPIRQWMFKKP